MHTFPIPTHEDVVAAIHSRGKSVAEVCRLANVDGSLIARWKAGTAPSLRVLMMVKAALDKLPVVSQ